MSTSLIDSFIEEQQRLTAVERFSEYHERLEDSPAQNRYEHLLPASPPGPGEQYAFRVDLDKCSGCKACVAACHSLNGLDDTETWRDVGLLVSAPKRRWTNTTPAVVQHITTACHHCVDPACLNGCPVLAYDKNPVTGIVRHLDDQCIGCQYCVLKCPYDVPKYNERLGIVRKCDMCAPRLASGEAPACAQSCPNEAIAITKVKTESITQNFRQESVTFLPGAANGQYTLPTTQYAGSRVAMTSPAGSAAQQLVAADDNVSRSQPAHWPLVWMLVLSQASVGVLWAAYFYGSHPALLRAALVLIVGSIGASVFHLGRPAGAWRFFLGLRRSWLSREILAFSIYLAASCSAVLNIGTPAAMLAGAAGVFCSVMIYHDTRRDLWNVRRSVLLFFGTCLLLGAADAAVVAQDATIPAMVVCCATVAKLAVEVGVVRHVTDGSLTPLKRTALLLTGRFQAFLWMRLLCAIVGGLTLPLVLLIGIGHGHANTIAWIAFLLLFAGECIERMLFFRAVHAPKMPGAPVA